MLALVSAGSHSCTRHSVSILDQNHAVRVELTYHTEPLLNQRRAIISFFGDEVDSPLQGKL